MRCRPTKIRLTCLRRSVAHARYRAATGSIDHRHGFLRAGGINVPNTNIGAVLDRSTVIKSGYSCDGANVTLWLPLEITIIRNIEPC
jgi:hypothetical protein